MVITLFLQNAWEADRVATLGTNHANETPETGPAAGLSLSGAAQATLIDRGGRMIYDDVLDITWLQDANYAMTSGHDADGRSQWNRLRHEKTGA